MPIFDHRCKACGYTWEGFVHHRSLHPPCPKCTKESEHAPLSSRYEHELQLRSATEIKKRVTGDIRKLNSRLLVASNKVAIRIQRHAIAKTPQGRIVVAFFKKAVNTFRAIQLLKSDRLLEESFVLLRVLLETHVNLIFFLKGDDQTALTRRWADASMLEKLKYLNEVAFFEGTELEESGRREKWEEAEARIVAQYSKAELHALKKYGYSGLNIQQRAQAVGLRTMYSDIYRITSRSVHMFDPAETGMMGYLDDEVFDNELLSSRRAMLDSAQNLLLGRLAFLMSEIVDDALITVRMLALGLGYEKYRDKQGGGVTVDHAESGTFYLWRE